MVVHGAGGLDEFSPSGLTFVAELTHGQVRCYELGPADFGLAETSADGLRGGAPARNAAMLLETLQGKPGASRVAALMTAAAGLLVVGRASSWREGSRLATSVLDGGQAMALLERLRTLAPLPASP
jgi:anthranilate phosphoribosyltransferase